MMPTQSAIIILTLQHSFYMAYFNAKAFNVTVILRRANGRIAPQSRNSALAGEKAVIARNGALFSYDKLWVYSG